MKISEMKLHAMKAVKAYFQRDLDRHDMMNNPEEHISQHAFNCLDMVYLPLICAHMSSTFGSLLHFIWEVGGLFTLFTCVASILWLFFTSPLRVKIRVILLMITAYSLGASVCSVVECLYGIDQSFIFSFLGGTIIGFGTFWWGAMLMRRRPLYACCELVSNILLLIWLLSVSSTIGGHTARWKLMVDVVLASYMWYIVVYSPEIVYNARFGDIDFVNRTFTILFHLPAIVVHTIQLHLVAAIQHYYRHN